MPSPIASAKTGGKVVINEDQSYIRKMQILKELGLNIRHHNNDMRLRTMMRQSQLAFNN